MRTRADWALIAAASAIVAAVVSLTGPGQRLEYGLADAAAELRLREVRSDVVIVAIDSHSLREVGQWPWPRRLHAGLIDRLAPAAPARLFLDVDFSVPSTAADDAALARALRDWRGGPVILPAFAQQRSATSGDVVLTEPLPALAPWVETASVNLQPADDGLVRTVRSTWQVGERVLPSVSAMLSDAAARAGQRLWIDFTIDPASFTTVSYSDVLENRVSAQYFADKLVFVGATAIELGDMIPVPVHQALPGVVVQALAFESLNRGASEPLPVAIYWPLVLAWALLLARACRRGSWRRNSLVAVTALAVVAGFGVYANARFGVILAVLPFAITVLAVYLLTTVRSLESETLRAIMYAVGFRRRDALLKSIVQSSTDSIVCIDGTGTIRTANPASARLFGLATGSLVGASLRDFVPDLLRDPAGGEGRELEDLCGSVCESTARPAAGDEFPVELSLSRVRVDDERLYTAIVRDISERMAQQRQLQFQATHDALTALPNRPALAARLDSVLQGGKASGPVALLMIDLNRFKEVNDTLGHNVGDYVLHEVACRLDGLARDRGFIARIGGDEFALVMDRDVTRPSIASLSQSLVDSLKEPVETCGVSIDVGLSIGVALYPENATSAEELFRHSDVAMYAAKRANTGFEFYDPASDPNSVRRLEIAARLRRAIAGGDLALHYQPQVNLQTGVVESVEALIRWSDPVLGNVRPDEFITLAETTDLIQPLSDWTMREAFRQSELWRQRGIELLVAINVSARLLQDASFPARVARLMTEAGARPGSIELEITESAMMLDPERALAIAEKLSDLGVQISIDDYGTGYSSLSYLRDLPAHALKLDKSFVTDLERQDGDRVIAASTVQMAHALNLAVVAEGVETAEVAELLRDMGYDYAQGYLYSPALPADALADWLRACDGSPRPAVYDSPAPAAASAAS